MLFSFSQKQIAIKRFPKSNTKGGPPLSVGEIFYSYLFFKMCLFFFTLIKKNIGNDDENCRCKNDDVNLFDLFCLGAGDLDAKTMLQLRVEKEWKHGKNIDLNRVGGFEKYTRGFGGNIMKKQGWKVGQSLGSSQVGITEPIPNSGQHPSSKRGLGFYGEKLVRTIKRPRPTRELVISTIYDKEDERKSELFQSEGPYSMKYRDKVDFVPKTGKL